MNMMIKKLIKSVNERVVMWYERVVWMRISSDSLNASLVYPDI